MINLPAVLAVYVYGMCYAPGYANRINAFQRFLEAEDVNKTIPTGYNRFVPPTSGSDEVGITLSITSIEELNIKTMEIGINFELTVQWVDDRLNKIEPSGYFNVIRDNKLRQHFWYPVVDIGNHLVCKLKAKGLQKSLESLMTYYPAKKIMMMEYHQSCNFKCLFDLTKYPLDTQTCQVEVIETMYNKNKLKLIGHVPPLQDMESLVMPPEWQLLKTNFSVCNKLTMDNCIQFNITLRRLISHHVITVFIPSVLVVAISWIAFSLNIEQIAPRVTLGLTTLMTLGLQFQSCQKGLPVVAYVKAIDVWCIGCILTVFLTLMEFAISHYLHRKWKAASANQSVIIHVRSVVRAEPVIHAVDHDESLVADRIGGIVIPLLFVSFVVAFCACFYP